MDMPPAAQPASPQPFSSTPGLPISVMGLVSGSQATPSPAQNTSSGSNNTPSPLSSVPQSMTVSQLINSHNLLTAEPNTSGSPVLKTYSLSDLVNNLPLIQSQDHSGYSGQVTSAVHPASQGTEAGGKMPPGYDPNQDYNGFLRSQCTSYASWYWSNVLGKKFTDVGGGANGNAKNWTTLAKEQGYAVSSTPQVGDIGVFPDMGVYGHVVVVTGVNPNGSIDVSEMNYIPNKYTTRSNVSTKDAQFIH